MENLLLPVSTSHKKSSDYSDFLLARQPDKAPSVTRQLQKARNPDEALKILRNEPDYQSLVSTLLYLATSNSEFSIIQPSPLAAQLVHVLVSETVPTYWSVLKASSTSRRVQKKDGARKFSDSDSLLFCLRSVTGLNAILLHLKQSIQKSLEVKKVIGGSNIQDNLKSYLQVLCQVLEGNSTVLTIATSVWCGPSNIATQKTVWHEFLGLIGGGKILGISAEAEDVVSELSGKLRENIWISNGALYSTWLAQNIIHWAQILSEDDEPGWKSCAELLSRSFRLGHTEIFIKEAITRLALQNTNHLAKLEKLVSGLPNYDQNNFLLASFMIITKEYLSSIVTSEDDSRWWQADSDVISASAGLIRSLLGNEEFRTSQVITWLTSSSGAGVGEGIAIRRAIIAALAKCKTNIETVLEKSIQQFGDQLYIRHTPAMQQDVHAQVLLLSAGYVHRKTPMRLATMMRSGTHLELISNRLSAPSPRARFLGMVVGEALSSLVDKDDKKMDFKMEELHTSEAKWYKSLVGVSDSVGTLNVLRSSALIKVMKKAKPSKPSQAPRAKPTVMHGNLKVVSIEEVEDSSDQESDGDGLTAYAKPDSDEEDSDEDATLITRNKPTAPVYIRDLITYLRESEDYDKQKLGLQTAAPLIRRKATFGTEVSSHAEELASLLVGMQDKYELENFLELRSQGMIAVLVAQPLKMGQWFSKTFFDGDYSISQRASVLVTLGLGARELGGFAAEDSTLESKTSFPSKTLPETMHKLYAQKSAPQITTIDNLSTALTNTMITPMAASLADKLTGPSVLKVRTFSSRMAVEQKRKKPTTNALAKVVADGFFFPLTGRFFIDLKAYGTTRSNITFEPFLLALFIKTLSLLLHASGPSSLSLPQMTSEFWDLLLSLRTQSIGDITVIGALLFGFLTLLEMNEDKRGLVETHGRQMLETQEWVEGVFGRIEGGSEEEQRVRMLAAGCLVRIRETVEKYQALLMGDMANFQN